MIIQSDVDMCKAKLASMIGQTVKLTSNGGRKRIITRVGVIETCYPNFLQLDARGRLMATLSWFLIDM